MSRDKGDGGGGHRARFTPERPQSDDRPWSDHTTCLDYSDWDESDATEPGTVPVLIVVDGAQPGLPVPLDGPSVTFGRAGSCDIRLIDSGLSRRHMRVVRDDRDAWFVEDTRSTNGVWVNGTRVTNQCLTDGDKVEVGRSTVLRFAHMDPREVDALMRRYDDSIRDELTGVHNRRYFLEMVRQELSYAVRHRKPLGIVILDIDRFKSVNDRFGHRTGDEVLKGLAHRIHRHLREEDTFARYGGEEFAMLLRGLDANQAFESAERVRKLVESIRFSASGANNATVSVTSSLGVAVWNPGSPDEPEELLDEADRNLYRAKVAGRNRTMGAGIPD